jgi:hypothetical protein
MMSGSGYKIISLRRGTRLALENWPGSTPAVGKKAMGPIVPIKKKAPYASTHQIHAFLVAMYKEEPSPPNVNEAYELARQHFKNLGKRAPRKLVREVLAVPEFDGQVAGGLT